MDDTTTHILLFTDRERDDTAGGGTFVEDRRIVGHRRGGTNAVKPNVG